MGIRLLVAGLTAAACSPGAPVGPASPVSTANLAPSPSATRPPAPTATRWLATVTPLVEGPTPAVCRDGIEPDDLPAQAPDDGSDRREPLSRRAFADYLNLMGITTVCIPAEFGPPFLNVDWNDFDDPPVAIGRMVSLGFEGLYEGSGGWGRAYIVYSTYDFEVGAEYQTFATPEDLESVREGRQAIPLRVDGAEGLIRYQAGLLFDPQRILKTYVFPFEDDYVAAVFELGTYEPAEVPQLIEDMQAGRHPDLMQPEVGQFDRLVASFRFR